MKNQRTARAHDPVRGYGNLYTPHAGSMIIQLQRENGLASRTIILSQRQVRLLRLLLSRTGLAIVIALAASWFLFAVQAARVPVLTKRIAHLESDARRIDTLRATLGELQQRYDQVQKMLGAATVAPSAAAPDSAGR